MRFAALSGSLIVTSPCETITVTSKHPVGLMCNCCCTRIDDHLVTVDETDGRFYYCSQGCALAAGHGWEAPNGGPSE